MSGGIRQLFSGRRASALASHGHRGDDPNGAPECYSSTSCGESQQVLGHVVGVLGRHQRHLRRARRVTAAEAVANERWQPEPLGCFCTGGWLRRVDALRLIRKTSLGDTNQGDPVDLCELDRATLERCCRNGTPLCAPTLRHFECSTWTCSRLIGWLCLFTSTTTRKSIPRIWYRTVASKL